MVRKNKGKKKKGGGNKAPAKVNNDDSSSTRVGAVWPQLDNNGCWSCTNCRFINSSQFSWSNSPDPGLCSECGYNELDEKFAVLIIPILRQLHDAGWLCEKKSTHAISVNDRSTWKPSVVLDAQEVLFASSHLDYDVSIDNQFQQLHRLIKVRSLIYEEDSGSDETERLVLAVRMIMDCQNEKNSWMKLQKLQNFIRSSIAYSIIMIRRARLYQVLVRIMILILHPLLIMMRWGVVIVWKRIRNNNR